MRARVYVVRSKWRRVGYPRGIILHLGRGETTDRKRDGGEAALWELIIFVDLADVMNN